MLVLGLGLICVVSMALHMRHERTLKRVEALERRDQATACRAIVDHINNQEMSIINNIKEKQE